MSGGPAREPRTASEQAANGAGALTEAPHAPRNEEPSASEGPRAGGTDAAIWNVVRRLGSVSVLAVIASTLPFIGLWTILASRNALAGWLLGFESYAVAVYLVLFVFAVGLAVVPTQATALTGGYVLGMSVGFPATLVGFVGAAGLAYLIAATVSGDRALRVIREHPRAQSIHQMLLGAGWWRTLGIVTLIRLPPSPFALTNLALAATRVPVSAYLLGTLLGMTPRIAAMTYVGAHLKTLNDLGAPWWYFWGGVAATFVSLAILGQIVSRAINRKWEATR